MGAKSGMKSLGSVTTHCHIQINLRLQKNLTRSLLIVKYNSKELLTWKKNSMLARFSYTKASGLDLLQKTCLTVNAKLWYIKQLHGWWNSGRNLCLFDSSLYKITFLNLKLVMLNVLHSLAIFILVVSMYFQSEWKTVWILIRERASLEAGWSGFTLFSKKDKCWLSRTRVNVKLH